MDAPCLDCQKRDIENGCHANCKDYKKWKAEKAAKKQNQNEAKSKASIYFDYDAATSKRLRRWRNGNRH